MRAVSEVSREVTFPHAPVVDGFLRLQGLAGRNQALPRILDEIVREAAALLPAEVVSVYLRDEAAPEGIDRLVMRANVGFPASAVGHVMLSYGEGITGLAAECLRPVTTADATTAAHNKPVSGLGEERFPAYMAVPVLVEGRAAGVLVAQRAAGHPFDEGDLVRGLATAGAIAHAFDRARLRPSVGAPPPPSPVRLEGVPLSPGTALGGAAMLRSWADLRAGEAARQDHGDAPSLSSAIQTLRDELRRGLGKMPQGPWGGRLAAAAAALEDARLYERIAEATETHGVVAGLREVAREYALAPIRGADEATRAWLLERAREVEDFCLLLAARHLGQPSPGQGAVLIVPDRLGVWVTVLALSRGVDGVVVAGPVPDDEPAVALLTAAGCPVLSEVAGVYGWVRPGDRVLIDGDAGWLRVHPSLADVADHRRRRRGPPADR